MLHETKFDLIRGTKRVLPIKFPFLSICCPNGGKLIHPFPSWSFNPKSKQSIIKTFYVLKKTMNCVLEGASLMSELIWSLITFKMNKSNWKIVVVILIILVEVVEPQEWYNRPLLMIVHLFSYQRFIKNIFKIILEINNVHRPTLSWINECSNIRSSFFIYKGDHCAGA